MISVIIPAYNRGSSIERAIKSVTSAPYPYVEIIVVDDGSTDDTLARSFAAISELDGVKARVIHQENSGPSAARNQGAMQSNGRYLAFLDSDDYWLPGTLEAIFHAVSKAEQFALLFLQTTDVNSSQRLPPSHSGDQDLRVFSSFLEAVDTLPSTRYGSCNLVVDRRVFFELDGFRTEIKCSEDSDFFLRASTLGSCLVLAGRPLVAHVRGLEDQLTGNPFSINQGFEYMIERHKKYEYPGDKSQFLLRRKFLSNGAAYTVRSAFIARKVLYAYILYVRYLPLLLRGGNWHWIIRLPLYPILALLKPSSYLVE